jgi:hypothetical protein
MELLLWGQKKPYSKLNVELQLTDLLREWVHPKMKCSQ